MLAKLPEVVEACLVSGEHDYLLHEKLYKRKGVRHSKSSFVRRMLKKADLSLLPI